MFQIKEKVEAQIEVEKSRFISYLFPLKNEEDVSAFIKELQKLHPKARHICYAMVFDNHSRSNDDGEPSGTAGRPLAELLKKNELNRVLLVVVRYFGGVLLGAGRLLRTYVEAGKKSIEISKLLEEKRMRYYEVILTYEQLDQLETLLRKENCQVVLRDYQEQVTLGFYAENDWTSTLSECFKGQNVIHKMDWQVCLLPIERR